MEEQVGRRALEADAVRHRLDVEIGEVMAAVDLVARRIATRVDLNGLVFGDVVRERLREEAENRGVRIDARVGPEDVEHDLVVSAIDVR